MSDLHQFPFSLFATLKHAPKAYSVAQTGGVYLGVFDRSIGRSVLQVRGSVSANNYIEYGDLSLRGSYVYLMIRQFTKEVGTFHLEIETVEGFTLRITLSTLYESVRFLGRSLRLPLAKSANWMIVALSLNDVLKEHCLAPNSSQNYTFKEIKVLQGSLLH